MTRHKDQLCAQIAYLYSTLNIFNVFCCNAEMSATMQCTICALRRIQTLEQQILAPSKNAMLETLRKWRNGVGTLANISIHSSANVHLVMAVHFNQVLTLWCAFGLSYFAVEHSSVLDLWSDSWQSNFSANPTICLQIAVKEIAPVAEEAVKMSEPDNKCSALQRTNRTMQFGAHSRSINVLFFLFLIFFN